MDTLSSRYANLFSGSLAKSLQLKLLEKKRWLTSIWAARDKLNGGIQIWDRSSNVDYNKWKVRKMGKLLSHKPLIQSHHTSTTAPLTIQVNEPSDEEDAISDTNSTSGQGNSPIASYDYGTDTETLTISVHSTQLCLSPGKAQTPTRAHIHPQPVQDYIVLHPPDRDNTIQFKHQSHKDNNIIARFHQQLISSHSLQTTDPGQWLNDEIINFYISTLNDYDHTQKDSMTRRRHHFFNSFFITKLLDEGNLNRYNYHNVLRWSRRVYGLDLFQLHKIFFPCNISQSHWSCVIVNVQNSTIMYYDSMRGNGDRYMHNILHYLQDDWLCTKGYTMPHLSQWTLKNDNDVPVQDNLYDCGVFVCLFATCMVLDCDMEFDQSDAPLMRMKLAHLIYTHCLNTQHSSDVAQPTPARMTTIHTQVITQDISQTQSQQPSSQDTSANDTATKTGCFTIMQGPKGVKRKFLNSGSKDQYKRQKHNPRHTSSSKAQVCPWPLS
jgi:hypothetical protein